ncbi:MAG: Rne/Rng family ribonuclease [Acidobacteriota bacterium]|nr:Rne/Rng family ribonuclease [Acidobacteriota bacterium]MDE3264140.1 Rne/Rng family ribonuclease [Acidobacteriota bacterium]
MTRRMLINARSSTELRIAIANDSVLEDLKVDIAERGLTRGNIYYGKIANIEPSLNAAFIDYGAPKHGFLAIQDVVPDAYYQAAPKSKRPKIEDVLVRGRPIVVQVTREPEGNKGAALTTNLSLAGRYLVLTPFDKTCGVSRKVDTEEVRLKLKAMAEALPVPDGGGVIVRTNALGQTKTALNRDMNALLRLWKRISRDARDSKGTRLLYSDQDIVLQGLRDYLDSSIQEVLVDEDTAHGRAEQYMRAFMPRSKTVLNRYTGRRPLFSVYDLEPQIQNIFERRADLPSGGSIVIDPTEALTAIDVNSGRSKKGASQEETAVGTNVEAAAEVGRQLRLRDIGGLIVVDFIDMRSPRNRRKVEKAMKDAMKPDKARFTVSRISANGLLEINRQRIHQALQMRTHGDCAHCGGTGRVASPDLIALRLLRNIESHGAAGYMRGVRIAMQPELADFLQNRHREALVKLGHEFELEIEISGQPQLHGQEPEISWLARDLADVKKREREEAKEKKLEQEMLATPSIGDTDEELESEAAPVEEAPPEGAPKKRRRRGGRRRRSAAARKAKARPKEKESAAERAAKGGNGAGSPEDGGGTGAIKVSGIDSPGADKGAQGDKADAASSGNGATRPSRRRRRRRRPRRSQAPEGGGGDKPQPAETGTN